MKLFDAARRSGRSLKSAKLRTLLTALAIAVGGFTLCLTLAAGNGVREYTDNLVASNFDPAELLVGRDPEVSNTGSPNDKPQEYDDSIASFQAGGPNGSLQIKQVTRSDIEELRAHPAIERVRENYILNIRYITRDNSKKLTGNAEAYNPAQKPEVIAGELPSDASDIQAGEILLPQTYLEPLGFANPAEALGESISVAVQQPFSIDDILGMLSSQQPANAAEVTNLTSELAQNQDKIVTYRVRAVTRRPATSLSFGVEPIRVSAVDARQVYDFTNKGSANYDQYMYVSARVKDGSDKTKRDAVEADLEAKGYYVMSSEDIQKTITQFVDVLQGVVAALGGITLIASIFGIINTQYISVLERTREIGLIKALGMSGKIVLALFIFEAMWIGFIGGLIGIIAGILVGSALNPFINEQLNLSEGTNLIIFDAVQLAILLTSLMIVAAVAGLLPARKAARLDPVAALRAE